MLVNLSFSTSLRSMHSFLGSLNCYSRFIEDFSILASVLYELRETKFFEISQMDVGDTTSTNPIKEDRDPSMEER